MLTGSGSFCPVSLRPLASDRTKTPPNLQREDYKPIHRTTGETTGEGDAQWYTMVHEHSQVPTSQKNAEKPHSSRLTSRPELRSIYVYIYIFTKKAHNKLPSPNDSCTTRSLSITRLLAGNWQDKWLLQQLKTLERTATLQ